MCLRRTIVNKTQDLKTNKKKVPHACLLNGGAKPFPQSDIINEFLYHSYRYMIIFVAKVLLLLSRIPTGFERFRIKFKTAGDE